MNELEVDEIFDEIICDVMSGTYHPPAKAMPKMPTIDTERIRSLKSEGYSFARISNMTGTDICYVISSCEQL